MCHLGHSTDYNAQTAHLGSLVSDLRADLLDRNGSVRSDLVIMHMACVDESANSTKQLLVQAAQLMLLNNKQHHN